MQCAFKFNVLSCILEETLHIDPIFLSMYLTRYITKHLQYINNHKYKVSSNLVLIRVCF